MYLINRQGQRISFKEIKPNTYKLELPENTHSLRVGYTGNGKDKDIYFIDPDGGPFIDIGYILPNGKIVKKIEFIEKDTMIYTEN